MMEKAIEKINAEMQKDPDNQYMEIIGQYLIDRAAMHPEDAEKLASDSKTLDECLKEVRKRAKKKAKDGVAVIDDGTVFGWVDEYFGIANDTKALDVVRAATAGTPVGQAPALDIDFADFL